MQKPQDRFPKGKPSMTENGKEQLARQYAAGEITWRSLHERGFEDYVAVLAALGELGLRPPIARMSGPNVAARERGRAMIREALRRISE
jgi:hypothetical protein